MKQIIIPYEEYLKLLKCYEIVNKKRYNIYYNYDEEDRKRIMVIEDTELLDLFTGDKDEIVVKRG